MTLILIPAIEKRIYELNVEVTNHKKGVKNVFKSFWRKPNDGLGGSMHGSTMNFSSHGSVTGSVDAKWQAPMTPHIIMIPLKVRHAFWQIPCSLFETTKEPLECINL